MRFLRSGLALAFAVTVALAGCPDTESPAGPSDAPRIDGGPLPDAPEAEMDAPATDDAPTADDAPATDDAPADDAPATDAP